MKQKSDQTIRASNVVVMTLCKEISSNGWSCDNRLHLSKRVRIVHLPTDLCCRAISRYMASLSTPVANFTGSVERSAIGSGTVARDMALVKLRMVAVTVVGRNQPVYHKHNTS